MAKSKIIESDLLFVSLEYYISDRKAIITNTNVRPELIDEEIFTNWIRSQIGKGKDSSPIRKQEVYSIDIRVDLSYDIFFDSSDTGNKSLTAGIVIDSIGKWEFSKDYLARISDEEFQSLQKTLSRAVPKDYQRPSIESKT